jgi:hypothetical protein
LTEKPKTETPAAETKAAATPLAEPALVERLTAVFKDAMNAELDIFKAKLKAEREEILKQNQVELENALRKALGVDKDLPVMKGELMSVLRKAMLEVNEEQKRAPSADVKAAPEGNKTAVNPIDKMYDDFGGKA